MMQRRIDTAEVATFAGGCFWCLESDFRKLPGVLRVVSGYSGGTGEEPTYEDYAEKGHLEAVQVIFDPTVIRYETLLGHFWRQIDPSDGGGQFADRGAHYRSAIFYHDAAQQRLARESREALGRSGRLDEPIVTEILEFVRFYEAEGYHQNYGRRHPERYRRYRHGSGRDRTLRRIWGNQPDPAPPPGAQERVYERPAEPELIARLTPLQYRVTQQEGTEPPFENEYWDNRREGIYVDVVTGEPLFGSPDKYDSGTGWPSFTRPLAAGLLVEREDRRLLLPRTEVRSRRGNSHLGHLFPDGPAPTGLRYCINSAALRFVPKEELAAEGYETYLKLFDR